MHSLDMDQERWLRTTAYIREVFAKTDARHAGIMERAVAAGMPPIDAGPETGRFLQVLATSLNAKLIIEVGTLAAYSAIWLARGLAPGLTSRGPREGRVITIEASSAHAAFAQQEIDAAHLGSSITIRQGKGGEVLPVLLRELGPDSVDLLFFDAERSEYLAMLDTAHELLRRSGILAIDNALAAKRWTADPVPPSEQPDQMDLVNRAIAADARFRSTLVPVGNGVLIATKL
ncbi:MAG: class I SAM-dependent methyltransferase [Phycisphaeraceae bacterium]|nr:class I SAM-dependent methyltransferase [Phycisphaeraceae bacterium]